MQFFALSLVMRVDKQKKVKININSPIIVLL